MTARSTLRSWFRPARPTAPRPTFRPMLEALEARLPPGDVMSLVHAGTGLLTPALSADAVAGTDSAPPAQTRILASTSSGLKPAFTAAKNTQPAVAPAASPVPKYGTDGQASVSNPSAGADPFALFGNDAGASPNKAGLAAGQALRGNARLRGGDGPPFPPGGVNSPGGSSGPPQPLALSSTTWTQIGPAPLTNAQVPGNNPVSGRVTAIAADPTNAAVFYIGAAGGGVWKTADAGVTWTPLTDAQSTLFMGAIAVAPSNGNVIYAGTGEANNAEITAGAFQQTFYGRGVLMSADGGANWTLENNNGLFDRKAISKIVVDPTNAKTVYVAVAEGGVNGVAANTGIWKSTDGGAIWANTTAGIPGVTGASVYSDLIIDPNNANDLFCAIGNPNGAAANGVYETTNAGGSWAASGNFAGGATDGNIKLGISKANSKDVYASVSDPTTQGLKFVAKTTDGGTTWANTAAQPPNYLGGQAFYDMTIAVDPANANTVFVAGAAGANSVLETTDGGATAWNDISVGAAGNNGPHADHHAMAFDVNGKLLEGNDGGIWRLDNATPGSIAWSDLNTNLATLQFVGVALDPTNANIVYGGTQDNGTNKTTGPTAWQHIQDGDGGFVRVDFNNPNTVYHTFFGDGPGFIERSDTGGVPPSSWMDISAGINPTGTDNSEFYVPFVMDPSNPARLILGTDHIYETTNKGANWKAIATPGTGGFNIAATDDVTALAVAKTDGNTIYAATAQSLVGGNAHIFVTNNDGATWTQRDIPGVKDHIQTLLVDPTNAQTVYAVRDRFGGGKVFKSTDGGQTWANISGNLPDLPTYTVAQDAANNVLYVGTDNGVFSSADGGASWARFGAGLPNVQVRDLQLDTNLGVLAAGTFGRSVWEISTAAGGGGGGGGGGGFAQEPENNQTSDAATNYGTLAAGQTTNVSETIAPLPDGRNDYDWYRWTMGQAGTFTATETTTAAGPLEMHLFTLQGNTLVELGNGVGAAGKAQSLSAAAAAGDTILVEVKGRNSSFGNMTQGAFDLNATLT